MANSLFDLVAKLSQSSEGVENNQLAARYDVVDKYLRAQTEIRIFIANSQNFGHQSSSVNILRNLIDMGCTAKFFIALYANSQPDFDDLVDKIKLLIPQFKAVDTVFKLGTCDVVATQLAANTFPTPISLAITGGFDDKEYKTPPFALLNVTNYLQLQPYAWYRGNNLVMQNINGDIRSVNLDETFPALLLNRRAFFLPDPVVTPSDWSAIDDSPFKSKGEVVKYLLEQAASKINMSPAYGISTKDRGTPYTSLYNFIAGMIAAQPEHWEAQVPTVIPVISKFSQADWNVFLDLIEDPGELTSSGGGWRSGKTINISAGFIQWHNQNKITKVVKTIGQPGTIPTQLQVAAEVDQLKTGEVLVVYLEGIPTVLFNQLYANATLPTVFEGQNTAELLLNLGKPYFKLNRDIDTFYDYPTLPLGAEVADAVARRCVLYSYNGIYLAEPNTWNAITNTYPPVQLLPIIGAFLEPASDATLAAYFANLRAFFHTQKEDKLLRALDALVNNIGIAAVPGEKQKSMLKEEAGEDALQALYDKLESNIHDGVLNLLQAIPAGIIYDFFISVISDQYFTITDAVAEINDDKTEVTLTGNTNALLGSSPVDFKYTIEDEKINTVMTADFSSTKVTFPGAEWFTFSAPKLIVQLNEGKVVPTEVTIAMDLTIGVKLNIAMTIPSEKDTVLIKTVFTGNNPGISQLFQFAGGINLSAYLPSQIQMIADIQAEQIEFKYNYATNKLSYIAVNFGTPEGKTWNLVPGVVVSGLQLGAQVTDPADIAKRTTDYEIHGQFSIADATAEIDAFYPKLRVSGGLSEDSKPLILASLITAYLGSDFTQALPDSIKSVQITDLNFMVNQPSGSYSFAMSVEMDWPITIAGATPFTIKGIGFEIEAESREIDQPEDETANEAATTTEITGSFTGTVAILPNSQNVEMTATATYLGKEKGWTYEARQTDGVFDIGALLEYYLDWSTSLDIKIDGLSVKMETLSGSWEFNAKTAGEWDTPLGKFSGAAKIGYTGKSAPAKLLASAYKTIVPMTLNADGTYSVTEEEEDDTPIGYYGEISANIKWNNIKLTIYYNFNPDSQKYGIIWGILTGEIETKNIDGKPHQIATLKFNQSTTVGSIVETMISWATGTTFGLAAPWNILDSIPLNNLELVYDFTANKVSFNVKIGPIDLGFVTIKGIGISYNSKDPDPDNNGVIATLDITSAWGDVPPWNAAKPETTPAPPGQGNKYLDLRLLAMGQHITLDCFKTADNVQAAINCMSSLKDPTPGQIPDVHFDADSSWLIGMDFGVLKLEDGKQGNAVQVAADAPQYFLTLQTVFNDPHLYALRIALEGEPAKIFKGLDFQIMYKKISDSVGVYQAEIVLPDIMRKINMGQFNITLPVFGIAIYTNGDFQVDIGFPWKEDFSRSFTFQTLIWTPVGIPIPVMGSAGVYFGKLSSATTNKVPAATNGTFNPVLVFGFGIQFGFGYSFDAGILKAGFSLTAIAILEGVLAKWNPYQVSDGTGNNTQLETSYYFWFRGTVGIIGKLYGSIDFAIIKAEVNIDIRIIVQMTFAPYEPIELSITASVSVSLKVTINLGLFKIKISFSFSARIQQGITIKGIGGTPPWQTQQQALRSGINMLQRRSRTMLYDAQDLKTLSASLSPDWNNLQKPATAAPLTGYMGLGLTMAGDNAQQVSQQLACYVAMLFLESVPPPQDDKDNGRLKAYSGHNGLKAADGSGGDTSFEILGKQIFRWAIAAIQSGPVTPDAVDQLVVTDLQLAALLDYLNNPDNPTPIPAADIATFTANQFSLTIHAPSTGEVNATYFPVPPQLTMTLPDYGDNYKGISYSFEAYNSTSDAYTAFLRDYFNKLAVQAEEEPGDKMRSVSLDDANNVSVASFIYSDYFLLICRQMLQSARDSLKDFKYNIVDGKSVDDIVKWVNDTAGATVYTVEELFTDNVSVPLNAGKTLKISGCTYIVQAADTFDSIAAQSLFNNSFNGKALAGFNADTQNTLQPGVTITYPGKDPYKTLPGQSLKEVADAIGVSTNDLIDKANIASLPNLLLPVATLQIPDFNYKTAAGDTLNSIAAKCNITQQQLATPAENGNISDLFDKSATGYLDIANLPQFQVGELIKEIQATNGLQHLSGMTSRYYMAGLRLPTQGVTPNYQGMWVTDDAGTLKLPDYAGLYALTGQQFQLPDITGTDSFTVNFTGGGLTWLQFDNSDPSKLPITIKPDSTENKQIIAVRNYATANSLDIPLLALGAQPTFISKAATYPFTSEINWSSASAFNLPYGTDPGGVPALKLWQLPDTLLQLPDPETRLVNPRMKMQVGRYDEATRSMVNQPVGYYGYGTLVAFTIKRIPAVADSPTTLTTYEIMGADGSNAAMLEKMVSGIGTDKSLISTLTVAYGVDSNGTTTQGIQTDALTSLTMGIAQVNLSTETRPDSGPQAFRGMLEEQQQMVLLNETTDFIRLLWQASITRGGGYYLYYFNSGNNAGLPDRIFNDKNEATLSLLVVYTAPSDAATKNNITGYMNVLATGVAIDTTNSVLFAEADPYLHTQASDASQTLGALAYGYYGDIADVAEDNKGLTLRNNLQLVITEGVYEVGPSGTQPGGKVADIATYFGTTVNDIKNANPLQSFDADLPMYTAIYLPAITVTIGTSKGGNTLQSLSDYYHIEIASIANYNQNVTGIFADGQQISLKGGPDIRTATVAPGVTGVKATRPVPAEIPQDPTTADYGKTFLLNMYNMLSYQLADNLFFSESTLGLPALPMGETDEAGGNPNDKLSYPKTLTEGDNWDYTQSIPYSRFAKNVPVSKGEMPSQANSPYRGLGGLLQVDFAWQDIYGNRLITTLSNPTSATYLNRPPVLTGYTDAIIGLNQWPSVASSWEVNTDKDSKPQLQINLSFGDSYYQGLLSASVTNATTITALFTETLEDASAQNSENYQLNNGNTVIPIQKITLGGDKKTVTLQVSNVPENTLLTLNINNINNTDKSQTYTGMAQFSQPAVSDETTSTIIEQAKRDMLVYEQLWYQLTDPNGIAFEVSTSLLQQGYTLSEDQVSDLLNNWITSIYLFLANRAQGLTDVAGPDAVHQLSFAIDTTKLNPEQIFRLDLDFTIRRTRNVVSGDLETTGGILMAATQVAALSEEQTQGQKTTQSLNLFAARFEAALLQDGKSTLRIATGTDREAATNTKEIWAVRIGLDQQTLTPISYKINNTNAPSLFAPSPISNKLESRTQVPIYFYTEKDGIDFNNVSAYVDFTSIDMDQWGRQFFAGVDTVLSPEFTAAIQLVDNKKSTAYLAQMLANKKTLADIVKAWMVPLFAGENADATFVQEAFKQTLLVQLANAYTTQAAIQFDATVSADAIWPYGDPGKFTFSAAVMSPDDEQTLYLFFNNAPNATAAANKSNYTVTGFGVTNAVIDTGDNRRVLLTLDGKPVVDETKVSISNSFTDSTGQTIVQPLTHVVQSTPIAPRLYGNITRNFKFNGAMIDDADETIVYLFFSNPPDETDAADKNKFSVDGGLSINKAAPDPNDNRRVILTMSGKVIPDTTQITISSNFTDATGNLIMQPLTRTVVSEFDAGNNSDTISFTSPKLPLQSDGPVPLPFLLASPQIVRGNNNDLLPYVDLDLGFAGSSIEHQISNLPNIADYEASSWLSFVTPLGNNNPLAANLGKTQVPIVLREFPTSPSMVNQASDSACPPDATQIGTMLTWDYQITYSLPVHYPQDRLDFTVNFNVADNTQNMLLKSMKDAFAELAEFVTVYPSVYKVLVDKLTKVTASTDSTDPLLDTVSTALKSYNEMVTHIVTASEGNMLRMNPRPKLKSSNQVLPYIFYIQEGSGTVGETQALIVSIHGAPPEGIGQPSVNIDGYKTEPYTQKCTGDYCYYYTSKADGSVLSAADGQTIQERTIVLPAMNILARQDAATIASLKRNAELVPGKPSNEVFIYTTGDVEFANPYHPATDCSKQMDISTIGAPPGQHNYETLVNQLTNLFNALLEENSQDTLRFLMTCQYSYQLNSSIGDIMLPVMMQPMQNIQVNPAAQTDDKKLADMITEWATSITLWYDTVSPDTSGAAFWFDLTIFSNLTEQPLPLVRLRSLNLGVQYITDL